ncbi:hypothetical protein LCGC14_1163500, partial [marine sediment metagenome]
EKRRKIALTMFADKTAGPYIIDSSDRLTYVLTNKFNVGNGTSFVSPLNQAATYIEKEQQYKLADVLLITDGQSSLADDWIERYIQWKNQLEFRLYGVHIGGGKFATNQLPMFDAVASVGDGNVSKLDWFEPLADRMVR